MRPQPLSASSPVQFLKGVGPKKATSLLKLGIRTVADLLFHFPVRYSAPVALKHIDKIEADRIEAVRCSVKSSRISFLKGGRKRIFEVLFTDGTGILRATWFSFPAKSYKNRFEPDSRWIVRGKVTFNRYRGSKEMVHPETVSADEYDKEGSGELEGILAYYSLTEGIAQKSLRVVIESAMEHVSELKDCVPDAINEKYQIPSLQHSLRAVHQPVPEADYDALNLMATREQKKLIFTEFFLLQAGLALKRRSVRQEVPGTAFDVDDELRRKIAHVFPFSFTRAQERVTGEIVDDITTDKPMNRLLQGDVGSGKTAVALAAALMAVRNKKQAAIMAPTEILAMQHYKKITELLADSKVNVKLLTSGAKGKKETLQAITDGDSHITVGTHALIQDKVIFAGLGLVVIDEQHRFGVRQRAELIGMGENTHTLIMTATPIPRTLAMTLYGDLDISVLDELPPGRTPVVTKIYSPSNRESALSLIKKEVAKGRQAFIIYPLVEESDKLELKAAVTMYESLKDGPFSDLTLGLTHGRMKGSEKDEVMERFTKGEIDVLVSTTVVEVGIDQPNATVIMIEHAGRFGLSQLHQLRGRIGRSSHQSYCLLMSEEKQAAQSLARLKILTKSEDGFRIAEEDLAIRGSGDFFGAKQSGLPEFRIGDILRDHKIMSAARASAFELVEKDPDLKAPEHKNLRTAIEENWQERFALGEIG